MSDYNSTQVAAAVAQTPPKYSAREMARMKKVATIGYVMLGTESAAEVVTLMPTTLETIVHGVVITSDAIATTATVDIGLAGGDEVIDGADVAAAGLDAGDCRVVTSGGDLELTFATLGTPVAAKTLLIEITYSDNA